MIFDASHIEAISKALGHTDRGLSHAQIEKCFRDSGLLVPESTTKWKRINNGLVEAVNQQKSHEPILMFIRQAMRAEKYIYEKEKYDQLRADLNTALALFGFQLGTDGSLDKVEVAKSFGEAEARANGLREVLSIRKMHHSLERFCRAELLADNYFHAVLEAVKSVFARVRELTGYHIEDGAELINHTILGSSPILKINSRRTKSEISEQTGFGELIKGLSGMFRNPAAHEPRIYWEMSKEDAEDLFAILSMIHRRLDKAF